MSDFHEDDVVYIRPLGTCGRVEEIVVNRTVRGESAILGYKISSSAQPFASTDLELVSKGRMRLWTEGYLEERES